VGMPQGQVSAIMSTGPKQRRITAYTVIERIADGLGTPDHARRLLGLATADEDSTTADDGPEPWALAEALSRSSVSSPMMDHFERLVSTQAARYPSTPPAEMWPVIRRELKRAEAALQERQSLSIQRRLVMVMGTLAGIAGNLSVDFGRLTKAYEYFELSRFAAGEAENNDLAAWTLTLQSIDPFFRGYGQDAANLLDQAATLAGTESTSRRRSWIFALQARAHAAAGNTDTAKSALESAYAEINSANATHGGTDFFDHRRLDGIAGTTYLLMRDTPHATPLINAAIEQRPHADAKGRALLTLDKAACHLVDEEPEDVAALVHEALDLAEGQIVRPIVIRARELRARMRAWDDTAAIKALDARLAALRDADHGK
jgi:hypothetical protein